MVATVNTRAERLRHSLEEDILEGRLSPGTRLDETRLAERFHVSRTPVREALKYLESAGLVVIRPHQGAVVTRLTLKQLVDMFQVMAELEGLCARLAARRLCPEGQQRLLGAHQRCQAAAAEEGSQRYFHENNLFHEVIHTLSYNDFLKSQIRLLRSRLGPIRRYIACMPGSMKASIAQHQDIVDAILAGDEVAAERSMHGHLGVLAHDLARVVTDIDNVSWEVMTPR